MYVESLEVHLESILYSDSLGFGGLKWSHLFAVAVLWHGSIYVALKNVARGLQFST